MWHKKLPGKILEGSVKVGNKKTRLRAPNTHEYHAYSHQFSVDVLQLTLRCTWRTYGISYGFHCIFLPFGNLPKNPTCTRRFWSFSFSASRRVTWFLRIRWDRWMDGWIDGWKWWMMNDDDDDDDDETRTSIYMWLFEWQIKRMVGSGGSSQIRNLRSRMFFLYVAPPIPAWDIPNWEQSIMPLSSTKTNYSSHHQPGGLNPCVLKINALS